MKKFIGIFFLCWSVTLLYAQRPNVRLEVSTSTPQVGQTLTITVKANVQGQLEVDLPKSFQSGNSTMSSMQQEIDYNTGEVVTYFLHSQNGSFTRSGNFSVGPAVIRKGSKVFKSNVVNVVVKQDQPPQSNSETFTRRQLSQPAFGIIQTSRNQIFEGEPLVLNGVIYSRFTPTHLEEYESYAIEGTADKHALDEDSENIMMTEKNIGGIYFNTFHYDKQILFPLSTGKIKINPFKMLLMRGLESFELISSSTTVEVLPLPGKAPQTFTGAVGTYSTSCSAKTENVQKGSILELQFTVKGKGNLHQLNVPKLSLSSAFEQYGDPEVKEDFSFGQNGAEGKVTYTYFVKILKAGVQQLKGPGFSYFDPAKKSYISVDAAQIDLGTLPGEIAEDQRESKEQKDTFVSATKKGRNSDSMPTFILILLGAGIPLLLSILYRWKSKKKVSDESRITKSSTQPAFFEEDPLILEKEAPARLLNKASVELDNGNNSQFLELIEKAVVCSLQSEIGCTDTMRYTLVEKLPDEQRKVEFRAFFEALDTAKYGSVFSNEPPEQLLTRAQNLISGNQG
jgi:hypothetical protein